MTSDEIADLTGIFNAIRDGATISDYFGDTEASEATENTAKVLTAAAEAGKKEATNKPTAKKQTKPDPKPEPTPTPEAPPATDSNIPETDGNFVEEPKPENNANSSPAADDSQQDAEDGGETAGQDPSGSNSDDVF